MHVSIQTACVVIIPDVSYSRLKRNEVLLVFVIHFASDDIGNIHYCRNRGGKERKKLQQHGMYWVCGCLQNQSNGLLRWKSEVPGKYECLPSKSLRLLVGYEGSGVLMKEPLLRCHFTQLLGEKFFLERWRGGGKKWCFSPSHFKNLFDVEADMCASSHIFFHSHMHGEKNTTQTTSKHGGFLYTLSDYNTVTVHVS